MMTTATFDEIDLEEEQLEREYQWLLAEDHARLETLDRLERQGRVRS